MEPLAPIPPRPLPVSAIAPGKCIVFGEHAVVHGAPELLLAIDLTTQTLVRPAPRGTTILNADREALAHNPYFREAMSRAWERSAPPVEVRSVSRIPRAAGLGSSAAFAASLSAAFGAATGGIDRPGLAQRAFDIERAAQGVGSPGDTSASVAGGYVSLNGGSGDLLWTVTAAEQKWEVRRVEDPRWLWVVAHTGIARATGPAVRAVGERFRAAGGAALLEEFAALAREGIAAVGRGDRVRTAELMRRNQELLVEVGVSHPRLEALLAAAAPAAEAAKITGAGGGGSIVALPVPGSESDLVRRLARAGGLPFVVQPSARGAELLEGPVPS
ncbi:MAG: mevalonate kinase [Thermoplasmata archaeon]